MKSLRQLAREYANNQINRENYLNIRRQLLQGICAGNIKVVENEYLLPLNICHTDVLQELKGGLLATQGQGQRSHKKIVLGIAIGIFLCLIALFFLFKPMDLLKPDNEEIFTEKSQLVTFQWQILIVNFMQQKNWQQQQIASFISAWKLLTEEEMTVATKSIEMKRLADAIYQRLLAKQALLSLGDAEQTITEQQILVDLAKQLGIDEQRFTVLEPLPAERY